MSECVWTDERVDRLKSLWREGLSASQVARVLGGVSRNAVIGKLHRLKLTGSRPTLPRPRRAAPPRAGRPALRLTPRRLDRLAAPIVSAAPEGPGLFRCFAELKPRCCKWPIGDPAGADFSLCGRPTDGRPYCPGHHQLAHQPRRAAPITADPLVRRALAGERV
jgi:GcrA cell cycle regulator